MPDKLFVLLRKQNVGLYRDNGLAVVNDANGPKQLTVIFKVENLYNHRKKSDIKRFLRYNFQPLHQELFSSSQTQQRSSLHKHTIKPPQYYQEKSS